MYNWKDVKKAEKKEEIEKHWKKTYQTFSFFGGKKDRWLALVKFCILEVESTSDLYSLGIGESEGMSRHISLS